MVSAFDKRLHRDCQNPFSGGVPRGQEGSIEARMGPSRPAREGSMRGQSRTGARRGQLRDGSIETRELVRAGILDALGFFFRWFRCCVCKVLILFYFYLV